MNEGGIPEKAEGLMAGQRKISGILIAGALTLLGPHPFVGTAHGQVLPTTINEIFMYGVDADTNKLLRYDLNADEFVTVGTVVNQFGNTVVDLEGMAYIPSGPHKGFYATTNFLDKNPTRLVKINALDATAELYSQPVGFWKVTGLVPYQDPGTGEWSLLGTTKNTNKADLKAKLISINPTNGTGTQLMDLGIMLMTGLAMDANGTLYGVDRGLNLAGEIPPGTDSDLYIIDPWSSPQTLTHVAPLPWNKVEALEFAFGKFGPVIDLSTVAGINPADPTWSAAGVLFGFSDAFDMLMIINPVTGAAVPYPGSFTTLDCEGLVFCTVRDDPLYGVLRGFD